MWDELNQSDVASSTIVEIIDTVLRSVVTFLEGSSLAQTVFTCTFLHTPANILNSSLRVACLGLLRVLDKCIEMLNTAAVFEEEDVYLMTYGLSLASHVNEKVIWLTSNVFPCQQRLNGPKHNLLYL